MMLIQSFVYLSTAHTTVDQHDGCLDKGVCHPYFLTLLIIATRGESVSESAKTAQPSFRPF
jgi:hypothetical protein